MRKESVILQEENKSIKEKNDIYQLWKEVFGDSESYLDYYFQWVIPRNHFVGIYNKEELASMIHLNPYEVSFLGKKIRSYYIVGVATRESSRKQGLMRQLMIDSFDHMYQEHIPFTYLCPIDKAIYTPFDFTVLEEYPLWNHLMLNQSFENQVVINGSRIKQELLYKRVEEDLLEGKVRASDQEEMLIARKKVLDYAQMTEEDFEELSRFSNNLLEKKYDIYIPRGKEYFQELAHQLSTCGGGFIQVKTWNGLEGYMAYMMDGAFHVVELLCEKELESLLLSYGKEEYLSFVKEKEDNTIEKETRIELEDREFINTFKGSIMGRIISLKDYVQLLKSPVETTMVAYIEDKEIKGNTGTYKITIGGNTSYIEVTNEAIQYTFTIGEFMSFCQKNYTTFIHDVV